MNIDMKILMVSISFLCLLAAGIYVTTIYPESETTTTLESRRGLSELQITACNSADEGGTCDTKLPRLGLVAKEECCELLGRCCD